MMELWQSVNNGVAIYRVSRHLDMGQNVNFTNVNNRTVLHSYCDGYRTKTGPDSFEVLRMLLEKGAAVDVATTLGDTPLGMLVKYGYPVNHVFLLLGKGARVNKLKKDEIRVALVYAFYRMKRPSLDTYEALKLFTENRAIVDTIVDDYGNTPLLLLAKRQFPLDYLEILLKNGAKINHRNKSGCSVLHEFGSRNCSRPETDSLKTLEFLVKHGAEIDSVDNDGNSPLMSLMKQRYPFDHVFLLFSKGAYVKLKNIKVNKVLRYITSVMIEPNTNTLEALKLLIKIGAVLDTKDCNGNTTLMLLARRGFPLDHLDLLLRTGAGINHRNNSGCTVLHEFAKGYSLKIGEDNLKILELFLRHGVTVDTINYSGNTALMLFVRRGFPPEQLEILLKKGAYVNCVNKLGRTLLHEFTEGYCLKTGNHSLKTLEFLLRHNPNVDTADKYGNTPLLLLARRGFSPSHFELLLKEGADINCVNNFGNTLLHEFVEGYDLKTCVDGLETLKYILRHSKTVDVLNNDGNSPLMLLARGGFPLDHFEILLKNGVEINHRNKSGCTVLHEFAEGFHLKIGEESLKILELFLRYDANFDTVDSNNNTPLMLLAKLGFPLNHLEILLKKGANVNCTNNLGSTVLHEFTKGYHLKIGADSLKTLKLLASYSENVNIANKNGDTPLKLLLEKQFPAEYLEVLLLKSVDINHTFPGGNTVLHFLIMLYCEEWKKNNTFLDTMKVFLFYGADVDCKNIAGVTPLKMLLDKRFSINNLQMILEKGVNICGQFGDYPGVLYYILYQDLSKDLFQLMLDYGADPNETDGEGIPVLLFCVRRNKADFVRIICEYNGSEIDWDSRWGREIISGYSNCSKLKGLMYEVIFKFMLLKDETAFERFINNPVGDVNKLKRFVTASLKELTKMKDTRLNNKMMLYNFMVETDRRTLGKYLKFGHDLSEEAVAETQFPIYSDIIRSRIEIAGHWAKLSRKLDTILSISVENNSGASVELNHDCVNYVTRFLSNFHFEKFISACCSKLPAVPLSLYHCS